jgi:hypothetical protein
MHWANNSWADATRLNALDLAVHQNLRGVECLSGTSTLASPEWREISSAPVVWWCPCVAPRQPSPGWCELPTNRRSNGARAVLFACRSWAQWRSSPTCWPPSCAGEIGRCQSNCQRSMPLTAKRSERREPQKSGTRRLEEAGGLAGVVILDAHRRTRGKRRNQWNPCQPVSTYAAATCRYPRFRRPP